MLIFVYMTVCTGLCFFLPCKMSVVEQRLRLCLSEQGRILPWNKKLELQCSFQVTKQAAICCGVVANCLLYLDNGTSELVCKRTKRKETRWQW